MENSQDRKHFWKKSSQKLGGRIGIGIYYEENEENILAGAHAYTTYRSML
jgi:hypothetical protein